MEQNPTLTKKTAKDETIILQTWLNRDDPLIIATHQQVDADAAFSAALLRVIKRNAVVVFVRADSTISQPEVIAVDLMNGSSAVKGLGAGSSFGLIVSSLKQSNPSFYKVLKPWAKQLNLTDQAKHCHDAVVLADMVSAWRSIGLDDRTIVSRAGELLHGKLKFIQRRERQKTQASKIQIQGGVAVLGPDDHVPAKQLFQRGAKAVVREGKDGMAVILSRGAQEMWDLSMPTWSPRSTNNGSSIQMVFLQVMAVQRHQKIPKNLELHSNHWRSELGNSSRGPSNDGEDFVSDTSQGKEYR